MQYDFPLDDAVTLKTIVEKLKWHRKIPKSWYVNDDNESDLIDQYKSSKAYIWLCRNPNIKQCKDLHYKKRKIKKESKNNKLIFYGWALECLIFRHTILENENVGKKLTKKYLKSERDEITSSLCFLEKRFSEHPNHNIQKLMDIIYNVKINYISEMNKDMETCLPKNLSNKELTKRKLFIKNSNKFYFDFFDKNNETGILLHLTNAAFPDENNSDTDVRRSLNII